MTTTSIIYHVRFPQAQRHLVEVEMEIPAGEKECVIGMPVWTPGSYLVREFARHVVHTEASQGGKPLPVVREGKDRWRVKNGGRAFRFLYRVYAFERTVRMSFVDLSRATLNGPTVFCYVLGRETAPCEIEITPLPAWKQADVALDHDGRTKNRWRARDYEELADTVFELGNQERRSFVVDGIAHRVTMVGGGNWDLDRIAIDCERIVQAARDLFGFLPYSDYHFALQTVDDTAYGGLEHCRGALMTFPAWSFREDKDYERAIGLISHEYFHAWNVKYFHPVGLSPFAWDRETFTDMLWVAEGFTSYYELILLLRAGILHKDRYLEQLAERIGRYRKIPGRRAQTVADSSYTTWIKFYRPDENTPNTAISYYLKGAMVALLLEMEIRTATKGRRNLDDVVRRLAADAGEKDYRGYDFSRVRSIAEEVAGHDLKRFFARYVHGTVEIDFEKAFQTVNLVLSPREEEKPEKEFRAWLGVETVKEKDSIQPRIKHVFRDGPAEDANLQVGDVILAMDGGRVREGSLADRFRNYQPGDRVHFTFFRNGFLQETDVVLGKRPPRRFQLTRRTKGKRTLSSPLLKEYGG